MKQGFKSLDHTLRTLIKEYHLEEVYYENMIIRDWQKMVTRTLKNAIKPVKLEKNILYCEILNEAWKNELNLREKQLIKIICAYIKPYEIKKITFC